MILNDKEAYKESVIIDNEKLRVKLVLLFYFYVHVLNMEWG